MLIPLFVLAAGAIGAGFLFAPSFVGEHREAFWQGAIFTARSNEVLEKIESLPSWVGYLPLVVSEKVRHSVRDALTQGELTQMAVRIKGDRGSAGRGL